MNFFKKYLIEILSSVGFIIWAGVINLQLLEGSNVDYQFSGHDEYLTVREVYSILNPATFQHFFMAVVSGDIFYYGRIMFYTDALFSWLPYKIWGLTGMVYAIRMIHVIYLLAAVTILSGAFLKNRLAKVAFLAASFSMYYTTYFIIIPKPEPLQLLVLAVFLVYASQKNWAFGKHFFLLGIAYGIKFNLLTVLPLFFATPFLLGNGSIRQTLLSGLYFVLGLLVAVPCLLMAPLRPVFLMTYLKSTFGNTGHYDDTGTSVIEWIKDGWFGTYFGGPLFGSVAVILIILALIAAARLYLTERKMETKTMLMLCAAFLLMPVMLATKRLWPHYIWSGNVLLLLALAAMTNEKSLNNTLRLVVTLASFLLLGGLLTTAIQKNRGVLSISELRKDEVQNGKLAHTYLESKNSHLLVVQDISVYFPFRDMLDAYRYHPFASPYPYPVPQVTYVSPSFVYPALLKERGADYLLVQQRDFEDFKPGVPAVSAHDKMVVSYDSLLHAELGKTIIPDTTFGKLKVYRIANANKP